MNAKESRLWKKRAYHQACKLLADTCGSCPLAQFNFEIDCNNCNDNIVKCWEKYFLKITEKKL